MCIANADVRDVSVSIRQSRTTFLGTSKQSRRTGNEAARFGTQRDLALIDPDPHSLEQFSILQPQTAALKHFSSV